MTTETEVDVAIVGGGPAGLAAATALKEAGVGRVVILERDTEAGGVPRHCGHYPFGLRETYRLSRGPGYAARLVRRAIHRGVVIRTGTSVFAIEPGPCLHVTDDAGPTLVRARRVLLATGARETTRAARLIGGTKPRGVLSAGALQSLVYLAEGRPFRRPVIVGTELVSFSTLLTCRHAGIRPVAMLECESRPIAFSLARHFPTLLGVPVWFETQLVSIEGARSVTGVCVRDAGGTEHRLECDGVIVSGQFRPDASLLANSHLAVDTATGGPVVDQFGRASDPDYHVTGNLLRAVETAGWCWQEGRAAAVRLQRDLAGELPRDGAYTMLRVDHDALQYVLPQRWYAGEAGVLQYRVTRAVQGVLELRQSDRRLASRRIATRPERRLTLAVSALSSSDAPLLLGLREDRPWRLRAPSSHASIRRLSSS